MRWLLPLGAVLLCMGAVWLFSAQSGTLSSGLSRGVLGLIETELPGFYALLARWGRPEYLLRKLAHFSEYLLLGLLLYALLRRKFSPAVSALLAVMLAAGFALTVNGICSRCPDGTATSGTCSSIRQEPLPERCWAVSSPVCGGFLPGSGGENRRHNSRKRARSPAQGGQALFLLKNSHSARRIATSGTPASRNSPDTAS